MDNDNPSTRRRKRRFIPKAQPRKNREPTVPTPDADADDDDGQETRRAQTLLSEYKERRRGGKLEKKSSVQVAFGPGAADASSTSIRTFGAAKDADSGKSGSVIDNLLAAKRQNPPDWYTVLQKISTQIRKPNSHPNPVQETQD
ncbi:uncharacterized protein [Pyrus communis]|uniref:uncharacterized protein n=1 Tax=Pyrus communis TaxID=23211 RepID=UPI0035C08556